MTTPCAHCGSPIDDTERCTVCGALSSPSAATPTTGDGSEPPWVIPVRRPDPSVSAPSTAGLGQAVAVLVAGVVAFAAAMVFGAGVLVKDRGDAPSAAAGTRPTEVAGDHVEVGDTTTVADAADTSTSAPPDAAAATSTTSSSSTSTTSSTTTVADAGTGSVPRLSSSFDGGWVAQLTSIPQRAGTDRLEDAWKTLRADVPDAVVTVSDDWSTLRPGYWVFVHPGPFRDSGKVQAFCDRIDHECIPRQLTG